MREPSSTLGAGVGRRRARVPGVEARAGILRRVGRAADTVPLNVARGPLGHALHAVATEKEEDRVILRVHLPTDEARVTPDRSTADEIGQPARLAPRTHRVPARRERT